MLKTCATSEEGVVLVVVIFFVVVLSILVLQFSYLIRLDFRMASNFRDGLEAYYLAKAGVSQAIALLEDDKLAEEESEEAGGSSGSAQATRQSRRGEPEKETGSEKQGKKKVKDDLTEEWAKPRTPTSLGRGTFVFKIVDEDRKFNLNLLAEGAVGEVESARQKRQKDKDAKPQLAPEKEKSGEKKKDQAPAKEGEGKEEEEGEDEERKETKINEEVQEELILLFDNLDIKNPKDTVKNIIDWIDADDDGEAEENYYSEMEPPCRCPNAPMVSIGDLALIKDIGPKLLMGDSLREKIETATDGVAEVSRFGEEERGFPGLRDYLTVYSDGLINVNTVSEEVLRIRLGEDHEDLAPAIIEARTEEPFADPDEIKEAIEDDIPSKALEKLKVYSSYFTILSEGRVGSCSALLRVVVQRLENEVRIVYWRYESG